jgi:hypothetical protein
VDAARLTALRYAAASQFEDGLDVAEGDPATAHLFCGRAVDTALALRFWQSNRWQPRGKQLFAALAALDPALADSARRFYEGATLSERIELAGRIVERVAGVSSFFEWESDPG